MRVVACVTACMGCSGSGNISANNIQFTEESSLGSGSGSVAVTLAQSPDHNLTLSSGSGDSRLDYDGHTVEGFFVFTARKDNGHIVSPYPFDKEEEYLIGDQVYMRKSFTRGSDQPQITISTGSGTAKLVLN